MQPLEFHTRHVPLAHLQPLSHFLSCQRQGCWVKTPISRPSFPTPGLPVQEEAAAGGGPLHGWPRPRDMSRGLET